MRILLDECVPANLKSEFLEHAVVTVVERGWSGIKNGRLLELAGAEFDAFITVDKNLSFQQNESVLPIAVIVIHSKSNKIKHISPLIPSVLNILKNPQPKRFVHVSTESS